MPFGRCDRILSEMGLKMPSKKIDRIRDIGVTGVQTCALPISSSTTGIRALAKESLMRSTFLDGMFKPISGEIQSHLQMASLSRFPQPYFWRVQIYGHSSVQSSFTFESQTTKLANLTLQVQEDWTGEVVVPQNFPSHFIKISPHKTLWTQEQARVCSAQDISLHCWPKLGFEFAQGILDF